MNEWTRMTHLVAQVSAQEVRIVKRELSSANCHSERTEESILRYFWDDEVKVRTDWQ